MSRKVAVVTGANSGIGLETTIELTRKGYQVVMGCRNQERAQSALKQVFARGDSSLIHLIPLDLASLDSIRDFVTSFYEKFSVLDILVNNAGVATLKRETTLDGFEMMMGVNHLGHFSLTLQLLDAIQSSTQGRIVNLSSGAHKIGKIDFSDPHLEKSFTLWGGYSRSKLANILFTKELSKRLAGTKVTVNAVHPGAVHTNIWMDRRLRWTQWFQPILRPFLLTPLQGAETVLYLACDPAVTEVTGEYFYRKQIAPLSKTAQDTALGQQLWTWSEKETGF